jgi:hypothetical protein
MTYSWNKQLGFNMDSTISTTTGEGNGFASGLSELVVRFVLLDLPLVFCVVFSWPLFVSLYFSFRPVCLSVLRLTTSYYPYCNNEYENKKIINIKENNMEQDDTNCSNVLFTCTIFPNVIYRTLTFIRVSFVYTKAAMSAWIRFTAVLLNWNRKNK